ncbi:MAG: hypothetical protein FJY67_05545, partial [Calditrichaeota bacterium]|nr:hypothetical protein [Calditrichota bacterium]
MTLKAVRVMLIALITLTFGSVELYAGDDDWMRPGENVEAGKIWVKVKAGYAPLTIDQQSRLVSTGIASLDAVADAFGVYRMEKAFAMKETPADPKVPDLSRIYTAYYPEEYGPQRLIEAYTACPEVEYAEWISIDRKYFIPNDARYGVQWHLERTGFPAAWDVSQGSRTVSIGIVDSGIDMPFDEFGEPHIHNDLAPNIWVNPGEDIDRDGVITLDDWDGRDNDGNGFVDDFHGWDLTGRDNWPHDEWARRGGDAHGTHVAGVASAATNNQIGVAGAGFNCRLMIAGCYSSREDGFIENGYQGIEYCGISRAGVLNCSWGSLTGPSQTQQAVINFVRGRGTVVFAAMGNDTVADMRGDRVHHYPGAYDGVIATAASNENDRKTGFSNWGDFVDLVAPGENIVSTFTNNNYISYFGTSMASPLSCGLGALMLSRLRLNEADLLTRMQETAVNISNLNNNFPGIVYRIDAGELLGSTEPRYEFPSFDLVWDGGNNDGRIDPTEHVYFRMTVRNRSRYTGATGVRLTVTNPDTTIRILRGEIDIGRLDIGESILLSGQNMPHIYVWHYSRPHYSTFTFTLTSNEGTPQVFERNYTIGHPYYLLLDDTEGGNAANYIRSDLNDSAI